MIFNAVAIYHTVWTLIDLQGIAADSIAFKCRNNTYNIYLATSSDPGGAYWTLRSQDILCMDIRGAPMGSKMRLYAKSDTVDTYLEIMILI